MLCIKCGARLTAQDYCPNCGADVKIYKRLVRISNAYYNNGLAKASVRDLSGAVQDLTYSLEINKYNTPARNLLGLIYFEMGEVIEALTQWVISKSLEPKKNIATGYIRTLQNNPARLETLNQTIRKYNQSLLYCQQGSDDLAIIQLKKVLSMNSKLIKAHQLLALLYIKIENYERAGREIQRILNIDRTNTLALQYQRELDAKASKEPEKQENKDIISYTSGNETIIMPANYKDHSGPNVIVNIIIGLVVGVALMWFLVIPARVQSIRSQANQQIVEYSDQISARQAELDSLREELASVRTQIAEQESEPEVNEEEQRIDDSLLQAASAYQSNDLENARNLLAGVDREQLSDAGVKLYLQMDIALNPDTYRDAYTSGKQAYDSKNYTEAISQLEPLVQANVSYENGYALYYLARSYEGTNQAAKAVECFNKFVELFPRTERAAYSTSAIQRLAPQVQNSSGETEDNN